MSDLTLIDITDELIKSINLDRLSLENRNNVLSENFLRRKKYAVEDRQSKSFLFFNGIKSTFYYNYYYVVYFKGSYVLNLSCLRYLNDGKRSFDIFLKENIGRVAEKDPKYVKVSNETQDLIAEMVRFNEQASIQRYREKHNSLHDSVVEARFCEEITMERVRELWRS